MRHKAALLPQIGDAGLPPLPLTNSQAPNTIMPTIATTLMMANQNSVSPYRRTFTRLIRLISTKNSAAEARWGFPATSTECKCRRRSIPPCRPK